MAAQSPKIYSSVGRLWILRSTAPLVSAYSDKIH